jgi:hypothetical protein
VSYFAVLFAFKVERHACAGGDSGSGTDEQPAAVDATGDGETGVEGGVPEMEGGPKVFERLLISPDAVTLGALRVHPQSFNDHFLDAYRMGLGMPAP